MSVTRADAANVAEAGMNLARSTLWAAPDATNPFAVPETTVMIGDASVTYVGTYNSGTGVWTLSGTSSVASSNPGASPVVRTVSSQVKATPGGAPVDASAAWNKLYVDDWSACTDIKDGAVVSVEVYVRGDLCMEDGSLITQEAGRVQVWGSVDIEDTAQIGTNTDPLAEVHVAGGCRNNVPWGGPFHTPCTAGDSVYSSVFSAAPADVVMPTVDLEYWYHNAKPGPDHGCTTGSLPAGEEFDDNTALDDSASTFELATTDAYDCQVWEGGVMVGRIAWSGGTTGTLTVMGTIFFDGDIHLPPSVGVRADYDGQATLYSSAEIEVEDDVWLCGVPACDATWDPQTDLLVLVADGGGWHDGVDIEYQSKFQGGVFSLTELDVAHDGEFWGSAVTRRVEFVDQTVIRPVPGGVFPLLPGTPTTRTEPVLQNVEGSYAGASSG